jgi:uncharacterized protein YndB with AHSA1/START domain
VTVIESRKDPTALTLTVVAEFDAPVARIWELWEDPRQLEQWWGPPTYPATVVKHDLSLGGGVSYFMTGPEGDRSHGWWRVLAIDPPYRLEFENGFADEASEPDPSMPVMIIRVQLSEPPAGGTRMEVMTSFPSPEAMEKIISMGMEEGMIAAMSQIDGLL